MRRNLPASTFFHGKYFVVEHLAAKSEKQRLFLLRFERCNFFTGCQLKTRHFQVASGRNPGLLRRCAARNRKSGPLRGRKSEIRNHRRGPIRWQLIYALSLSTPKLHLRTRTWWRVAWHTDMSWGRASTGRPLGGYRLQLSVRAAATPPPPGFCHSSPLVWSAACALRPCCCIC